MCSSKVGSRLGVLRLRAQGRKDLHHLDPEGKPSDGAQKGGKILNGKRGEKPKRKRSEADHRRGRAARSRAIKIKKNSSRGVRGRGHPRRQRWEESTNGEEKRIRDLRSPGETEEEKSAIGNEVADQKKNATLPCS